MKKRILLVAATMASVVSLMAAPAVFAADAQRIAVVNVQTLLHKAPQVEKIRAELKKQFGDREQSLVKTQKALQTNSENLHKNGSVMKAAERKALENKITAEQDTLQHDQMSFQQELATAQNKQMEAFLAQVRTAVEAVAKQENYAVVLTKDDVAYIADESDITVAVLAKLSDKKSD